MLANLLAKVQLSLVSESILGRHSEQEQLMSRKT